MLSPDPLVTAACDVALLYPVLVAAQYSLPLPITLYGQAACSRIYKTEARLRDVPWDLLYVPVARAVNFVAHHLDKVQFMTIRAYLTLVFGALVVLLAVLAAWQ